MSEPESVHTDIIEAQKICLEKGIPFFSYRLPDRTDIHFGAQLQAIPARFHRFEPNMKSGFILAPFVESEQYPAWLVRSDIAARNRIGTSDIKRLSAFRPAETHSARFECDVDRTPYLNRLTSVIDRLKQGELDKVVLSRTLTVPFDGRKEAPSIFDRMVRTYAHAFVFLVAVPGYGIWSGATPEAFFRQGPEGFSTMSLAGTQPVRSDSSADTQNWSQKEIEEQAIVSRYIRDILRDICKQPVSENGPYTREAASVYHLCTTFRSREIFDIAQTNRLIEQLHPSPAICGTPKDKALRTIVETERTDRRYYGGYLGPVESERFFNLFVNLRSMELSDDRVQLHIGGGITALSDAAAEWEETQNKARTLLQILEQKS